MFVAGQGVEAQSKAVARAVLPAQSGSGSTPAVPQRARLSPLMNLERSAARGVTRS